MKQADGFSAGTMCTSGVILISALGGVEESLLPRGALTPGGGAGLRCRDGGPDGPTLRRST